jgi:hypothetical protein
MLQNNGRIQRNEGNKIIDDCGQLSCTPPSLVVNVGEFISSFPDKKKFNLKTCILFIDYYLTTIGNACTSKI